MARDKKKPKAGKSAAKGEDKGLKKARKAWRALEDEINKEFAMLVREGFDIAELETLRWDYRYDKFGRHGLTQEQVEFFVAESDAILAGLPPPKAPGSLAAPAAQSAPAPSAASSAEYKRKSDVDMELIEKYLERRGSRETRSELESVYKQAFGEDLVLPPTLDLVDLSFHSADLQDSQRPGKLTKEQVLGIPSEEKPEEKKAVEIKAEAAPAEKREPRAAGVAMAWKRGVPPGPTRDEKWSFWNPLKFWVIPKRLARSRVGRYYAIFILNLAILILQIFPGLTIPLIIRTIAWIVRYVWRKFLKQRVAPAIESLKEKAAVPATPSSDAEKKPSGAKSS